MIGILDLERDVTHAVAVQLDMLRSRMLRMQRRRQYEIHPVLPHEIARRLPVTCFQSGIGSTGEAEGFSIVELGLLRIADVELDMVYFLKPQWILFAHNTSLYS